MGEHHTAFRVRASKPVGKRTLGRPKRRWVNNVSTDVGGLGVQTTGWRQVKEERFSRSDHRLTSS